MAKQTHGSSTLDNHKKEASGYTTEPKSPSLSQTSCRAEGGVTGKEGERKQVGRLETGVDTARLPELNSSGNCTT